VSIILILAVGAATGIYARARTSESRSNGGHPSDILHFDPKVRDLGELRGGSVVETSVVVLNVSDKPATIVGASVSCSCLTTATFPMTLKPNERRELPVRLIVATVDSPREFRLSIEYRVDVPAPVLESFVDLKVIPDG
jgi:hypothetical protein